MLLMLLLLLLIVLFGTNHLPCCCCCSFLTLFPLNSQSLLLLLFVCLFQGGLVFVCGTTDGLIKVSGRRHNCDDLKATILAVDPIKFVYRGR